MSIEILSATFREEITATWLTDAWAMVLLDATYVYDPAHGFLVDVDAGARVATEALTTTTNTGGVCDADDIVFATPTSGPTITQTWIFRDTGVEATSTLAYYANRYADGSDISIVSDGSPLAFAFDNGPSRIFKV